MSKSNRKHQKTLKRQKKLRLKRSSLKQRTQEVKRHSGWAKNFASKYRKPIHQVVSNTIGQPIELSCGQIALVASRLSSGRLRVKTGWLVVRDDPENPLVVIHAWNEMPDGRVFDLSPWYDCPFQCAYVGRENRDSVQESFDEPLDEDWHETVDALAAREHEGSQEIDHLALLSKIVANGGQILF